MAFSEDEGISSDPSPFTDLVCPDLFKSLLCKAKVITNLGSESVPDSAQSTVDLGHMLFSEPTVEAEVIPSPKLFLDVVQMQWTNPGAGLSPTGAEKKLYNVAADFLEVLQTSMVVKPVAGLASTALLPADCFKKTTGKQN